MRKLLLVFIALAVVVFWWESTYVSTPPPVVVAPDLGATTTTMVTQSNTTMSAGDLPTALPVATSAAQTSTAAFAKPDVSRSIDEKSRETLKKCFAHKRNVHLDDKMRLEDLVSQFGTSGATVENLVVNLHVRAKDGTVTRLHVGPHDSETTKDRYNVGSSDLRLFGVDSEDLPIPMPYPAELRLEKAADVIEAFARSGTVVFKERRVYRRFSNGDAASTVETDGRLKEMQLFFEGSSVGCAWSEAHLACACL